MSLALFFALYCLEAGLFFVVVPWTRVWTLSPLWHGHVALAALAMNPFVRGCISGFGIVHLMVGIRDIITISQARRAGELEDRNSR
jgi:hypothetical protein